MKKILLLSFVLISLIGIAVYGQSTKLEILIQSTGGAVTDTLDDGTIVTLNLSTDDAEQENDGMDALYDDDLDAGWEGAPEDQNVLTTGLRFRDIAIPQGATIDSAFVVMYAHEGKDAEGVCNLTITAEATDDAETFNDTTLITDRTMTTASVRWIVAEEWIIWKPYSTPDLGVIIQEIVDRPGWVAGNALALILAGEDQGPSDLENAREWMSFENIQDPSDVDPDGNPGDGKNHPDKVPKLVVYYTAPQAVFVRSIQSTGGAVTDTLDDGTVVTLNLSTDDAEQENDGMDALYDDDLDAGWEGAPEDQNVLTTGLRFRDIAIPQGATIDSAFVVMYAHEGKDAEGVCNLTITGEATDDAETFNDTTLITDRPMTTASVRWIVAEEWIIWKPYSTPDLGVIIQEIVDRPGWAAGNALALILAGEDQGPSDLENAREWMSFENIQDPSDVDPDGNPGDGKNHPDKVPKLTVYFSTAGGTSINKTFVQEKIFDVYPNPANGILNVSVKSDEFTRIQIFNAMGQLVRSADVTSKSITLDVSDLKSGLYIFRAVQKDRMSAQKVILK